VTLGILPKSTDKFNRIPFKSVMTFSTEVLKHNPIIHMEGKKLPNGQSNLQRQEKNSNAGGNAILKFI
jgi:hypothetical protein